MNEIGEDLSQQVPVRRACQVLGLPPTALYRSRKGAGVGRRSKDTPGSRRALQPEEKDLVRNTLNSERFADQAPGEIYASLLDEGTYLCSVSTMYRILREHQEVRERRDQLRHPDYAKPELLATAPNQIWTWDTPALACWCKCYQIARASEVDLFLPVCAAGSL
jgi:putative transposase